MPAPLPNLTAASSADSGILGDSFFAPVNIRGDQTRVSNIDWVSALVMPATASLVSGLTLYFLVYHNRRKGK